MMLFICVKLLETQNSKYHSGFPETPGTPSPYAHAMFIVLL